MVSWKSKNIIDESIKDKSVVLLQEEIISSKGKLDKLIIQYLLVSLNIANQTHIFHLLTKSHSEHIAIGDFYDSVREAVDSLAELSIGMGLDTVKENKDVKLEWMYNKNVLLAIVEEYRKNTNELIELTNDSSLMGINNVLIEIQSCIDNLNYKLGLNK